MRPLKYMSKAWRKIRCRILGKTKHLLGIQSLSFIHSGIAPDDSAEALTHSGGLKSLTNAVSQLSESTAKATTSLSTLNSIVKDFAERWRKSELSALLWAANNHPEWCAVLNRTKKRRIKKKYRDRVMRAYAAFNESEG